ncbi:MAG: hypothetical protein HZB26_02870, partial [Candidatus Hydrogenedentes bacterium]|nr:hypothetical protein [Candidatus Hydrogenedentota bacterium]
MEAYKKAIEEIVHPLVAAERRKNTLRRELWAHFCALIEEERRNGVEERTLLDKAFQRLGTTDEIRAAFTSALPRFEVFVYRLEQHIRKGPAETSLRYAWRIASEYFAVSLAFASFIGILCACTPGAKADLFRAIMPIIAIVTLSLCIAVWHVIALSGLPRLERLLRSDEGYTRRVLWRFTVVWIRQMIAGVLSALVFLLL